MSYRDDFPRDHRYRWEEAPRVGREFWIGMRNAALITAAFVGCGMTVAWLWRLLCR